METELNENETVNQKSLMKSNYPEETVARSCSAKKESLKTLLGAWKNRCWYSFLMNLRAQNSKLCKINTPS